MKKYVGTMDLLWGQVEIGDPGYKKDEMYMSECKNGLYEIFLEYDDETEKVKSLSIIEQGAEENPKLDEYICSAGVDSGLCGFYNNKPNFSSKEWEEFCDAIGCEDYLIDYTGVCSSSGWGDGVYDVYTNEDHNAFKIIYM